MNSFERFRNRQKQRIAATDQLNSQFIFKGYPSIKIENQDGMLKQAAVVNKQEKDQAYIYTQLDDPLTIGSVWSAKGLHWLISEEIIIIKDVKWHKYLAFLCNVELDDMWGYFVGPEKSYINIALRENVMIESLQHPLLILPSDALSYEDKIIIKGRPWIVQEYDSISTEGITYYSLRATTVSKEVAAEHKDEEVYVEKHVDNLIVPSFEDEDASDFNVKPQQQITITTVGGYFKYSNKSIKVIAHTSTSVIFYLPFGVDKCSIERKDSEGNIIEETYTVVE